MKRLNFYLVILIVFALPSYLVKFSVCGIPTTMLEVLIYIAFVLTIVSSIKYQVSSRKFSIRRFAEADNFQFSLNSPIFQFSIPIILFVIAGVLGTIIAQNKQIALGQFKAFIIDPLLFFIILIVNFRQEKKSEILNLKSEIIFKALILSGVLLSIHSIYQYLTGDFTPDGRVLGIYKYWENASPNYLALYLAPITVLAFSFQLSAFRSKKKSTILPLYPFTPLPLFTTLYLTGSRAAIGAVVIGISTLLVTKYWSWIRIRKIAILLLYCFIALLLIISWYSIKPDFSLSPQEGGRITSSNNIRWEIYQTTGEILKDKWLLGVGLGNYQNYFTELTKNRVNYPEYIAPRALTPHNIFLNIWVNMGLLGLIAFIWLLVLFFKFSIFNFQFSKDLSRTTYYLLLTTMMTTILTQGLLDTPYWKNDLAVMFWILLGLAIISSRNSKLQALRPHRLAVPDSASHGRRAKHDGQANNK